MFLRIFRVRSWVIAQVCLSLGVGLSPGALANPNEKVRVPTLPNEVWYQVLKTLQSDPESDVFDLAKAGTSSEFLSYHVAQTSEEKFIKAALAVRKNWKPEHLINAMKEINLASWPLYLIQEAAPNVGNLSLSNLRVSVEREDYQLPNPFEDTFNKLLEEGHRFNSSNSKETQEESRELLQLLVMNPLLEKARIQIVFDRYVGQEKNRDVRLLGRILPFLAIHPNLDKTSYLLILDELEAIKKRRSKKAKTWREKNLYDAAIKATLTGILGNPYVHDPLIIKRVRKKYQKQFKETPFLNDIVDDTSGVWTSRETLFKLVETQVDSVVLVSMQMDL